MIRGIVAGAEQRDFTLAEPPDWAWDAFGATKSLAGPSVNEEVSTRLIPVFACVRLLAESVGMLPLKVYRRQNDGSRSEQPKAIQYGLVHDEPNREMAADQMWEIVMGHLALWGDAFIEKVYSPAGVVSELWPIYPQAITRVYRSGREKRFEIGGFDKPFTQREILHIPAFGYDGLRGLSPIAQARQALGVQFAREEYEARFYANNAQTGGYIKHPKTLTQPAIDKLKQGWEAKHRGLQNAHRVGVLEEGASFEQLGMPLKDQQFVELGNFSVNQTARMFRIEPPMIGGDKGGSLTYSTVEGDQIRFVTYSLMRWTNRIAKALHRDRDLFPSPRALFPEFLLTALLRGDSTSRAAYYRTMREIGVLSPNEIRALENYPPRDGGEAYQDTPTGAAPSDAPADEADAKRSHRNGSDPLQLTGG